MARGASPRLTNVPLHVLVLQTLKRDAEARRRRHEQVCGKGLEDREYQRHVGRISECTAQLEAIERLMKNGLDELDDGLEEQHETDSSSGQSGRQRSHRRT